LTNPVRAIGAHQPLAESQAINIPLRNRSLRELAHRPHTMMGDFESRNIVTDW
jgi:hypothetical protein